MAQGIKVTIAKLGNLSSIPRTHIEAGEKWLLPLTSDLHMSAHGIPSMRLSSSLRDFARLTIEFRWWYRNSFLLVRVLVMPSNLVLKWNNSDLKEVSLFFWMEAVQRYEAWKWDVERKHQKHRLPLAFLGYSIFKGYRHPSYPSTFPGDSWRFGPWVCISHGKYKKFWDRRASKCLKCCCPIQISQNCAPPPFKLHLVGHP